MVSAGTVGALPGRVVRGLKRLLPDRRSVTHLDVVVCRAGVTSDLEATSSSLPTIESIKQADLFCANLGLEVTITVLTDGDLGTGPGPDSVGRGRPSARALRIYVVNGVVLAPQALARLTQIFDHHPDLQLAYSDAAGDGDDILPLLLPGFSPERLVDQMYLGQMLALRATAERELVSKLAGPGGQGVWPQISRAVVGASRVAHLPERLYRAAGDRSWAHPNAAKWTSPSLAAVSDPLVSIVIPTRGGARELARGLTVLVEQAVQSVLRRSSYLNYELVIVTTPGTPDELPAKLQRLGQERGVALKLVHDERPFNFSNVCNLGAMLSAGDILVFLNDDTEVINPDWLEQLLRHATLADIGAVGAKLLLENGTVQHHGIWCRGGHPMHRYETHLDDGGYLGALDVTQNCLAVTGACLAVERSKFVGVGGFSPIFPNSYNDVDLCLKLLDRGWRTVVEPRAQLFHYEASTRDPAIGADDMAKLHDRWRWRLNHDPFDNPNHDAALSDELPLPKVAYSLSAVTDQRAPRQWPLKPMVAKPPELSWLTPSPQELS